MSAFSEGGCQGDQLSGRILKGRQIARALRGLWEKQMHQVQQGVLERMEEPTLLYAIEILFFKSKIAIRFYKHEVCIAYLRCGCGSWRVVRIWKSEAIWVV